MSNSTLLVMDKLFLESPKNIDCVSSELIEILVTNITVDIETRNLLLKWIFLFANRRNQNVVNLLLTIDEVRENVATYEDGVVLKNIIYYCDHIVLKKIIQTCPGVIEAISRNPTEYINYCLHKDKSLSLILEIEQVKKSFIKIYRQEIVTVSEEEVINFYKKIRKFAQQISMDLRNGGSSSTLDNIVESFSEFRGILFLAFYTYDLSKSTPFDRFCIKYFINYSIPNIHVIEPISDELFNQAFSSPTP